MLEEQDRSATEASTDRMSGLLDDPILRPLLDDLCQWLARILTIDIDAQNFTIPLQTGEDLCRLALAISAKATEAGMKCPKLVFKTGAKPGSFQARCNIEAFIMWAKALGVRETCLFETVDIVELKYLRNVLICLLEISKVADVYGVEPPELVKLEKTTKIGWQDLIKLSMKRSSSGNVLSVEEITREVGAIQKAVEDEEAQGLERSSSIVLKWKEFTRNSLKARGGSVHPDPSKILLDVEEEDAPLQEEDAPLQEEDAPLEEEDSADNVSVEEMKSEEEDEEILVEEEILEVVNTAPHFLESTEPVEEEKEDEEDSSSERSGSRTPPLSFTIETINPPRAAESPTQISILVRNESTRSSSSIGSIPHTSTVGPVDEGEQDANSGERNEQIAPEQSQSTEKLTSPTAKGEEDRHSITWGFSLCFPAISVNPDGSPLTTEQYEELYTKRLFFLLLGILLLVLGASLAISIAVVGVNTEDGDGQFNIILFFILLAVSLLLLIIGSSLVALWVVQHFKIKSQKLVDYESLPSYGTM